MTAITVPLFDPLRDKSYRATALGRDIADFLGERDLQVGQSLL